MADLLKMGSRSEMFRWELARDRFLENDYEEPLMFDFEQEDVEDWED